jgi:hypothetical protein
MKKTDSGQQQWSEGPVSNSYYTQVGEYGVSVRRHKEDIYLDIHDTEGNIVDSVSDPIISARGFDGAFTFMNDLLDKARRNALGADKILREIDVNLDD